MDRDALVGLLARAFMDQAGDLGPYAHWNTRSPNLWLGGNFNIADILADILAAIEPAIHDAALEKAAVFIERHRVTQSSHPPYMSVEPNSSGPMSEPDVSQRTMAAAIRALKEKQP